MSRYGCHNRPPFAESITVFDGYQSSDRSQVKTVEIPHRMARDCQYTLTGEGAADVRCEGCKHKSGVGA